MKNEIIVHEYIYSLNNRDSTKSLVERFHFITC